MCAGWKEGLMELLGDMRRGFSYLMIVSILPVIDDLYLVIHVSIVKLSEFFLEIVRSIVIISVNIGFFNFAWEENGGTVRFSRLITCFCECDENKRQLSDTSNAWHGDEEQRVARRGRRRVAGRVVEAITPARC